MTIRARTTLALVAAGLLAWLVAVPPGSAEEGSAEEALQRIGRYEVSQGTQGLELARVSPQRGAKVALVLGVLLLLGAGALVSTGGLPSAVVGGIGIVLLGFAGLASLDRAVWRANEATLVREGFAGRSASWPTSDVAEVEVQERRLTGPETKQSVADRWVVRIRLANGDSAGPGLRFVAREEAVRAADALAQALRKPRR